MAQVYGVNIPHVNAVNIGGLPMSLSLVPYLNFPGNTREAMTYYQSIFGGKLDITTFADFGVEGPPDGTMHSYLSGSGFELMASDAMTGAEETWGGTRVYLSFMGDEVDKLKGWFDALAADGRVGMPLEKQVWGDTYGLVMDRYGLEWMFNISSQG
jgi:PhnB protein